MQQIQEIKPQAYKSITNTLTMEIALDDRFSDVVYYRYWGVLLGDWKEAEIEFSRKGDAYFKEGNGSKQYLNEFMRY